MRQLRERCERKLSLTLHFHSTEIHLLLLLRSWAHGRADQQARRDGMRDQLQLPDVGAEHADALRARDLATLAVEGLF